jgi:hypothetical protein
LGLSAEASSVGIWENFILPGRSVYIGWGLLRFESLCRTILPHRHDIMGVLDQGDHLPAIGWDNMLIYIRGIL